MANGKLYFVFNGMILDRKTPVNTGSVLHKYDPDVQLVLDYYPYGMVMKEGYCDTCDPNAVTQSTGPALKMVNTDYTLLPQNYPPLTGTTVANWAVVTGEEAEPQEEGQLSWEGTGGGMLFTCLNEVNPGTHELGLTALMEVTAEGVHEIEIIVDIDDAGELEAKIISYTDPEHTEYDVLTSTEIPTSTGYLLQFTPTTDTVWLWIGRKAEHGFVTGTKFKVTGTTTAKTTWTVYQMNIQGLLHSWRSPYRFAYNGQERVDDIKGKTNHNTALHWEYDTRRAWRWNRDPVIDHSFSSYAVFRNNPVWHNDVLGDRASREGNEGGDKKVTYPIEKMVDWFFNTSLDQKFMEIAGDDFNTVLDYYFNRETNVTPLQGVQATLSLATLMYGIGEGTAAFKGNIASRKLPRPINGRSQQLGRPTIMLKDRTPQTGTANSASVSGGRISISGRAKTHGTYDYVVTKDGHLVLGQGHSYMAEGKSVKAAGRIRIYDGEVKAIDNNSGHYQPTIEEGLNSIKVLNEMGVNTKGAKVKLYSPTGEVTKTFTAQ